MVFTLSNNVCSICEETEYTISPTDAKKYINFVNKSLKAKNSTEKLSDVHLCLFCTYSIEQFRKTASKFHVGCNVTAANCFTCNSQENIVKLSALSTEYRTKITHFSKHYNIQGKHLCVACFYLINFWRKLKSSWKSVCSNTLANIESEDDSSSKQINISSPSISNKKNKSQLSIQLKALKTTTFVLRKYKKIQTKFKLNKDDKLLHEIPFVLLQKDIESNLSKSTTPRRSSRSLPKPIESEIKRQRNKRYKAKLNKRTNAITGKLNNLSISLSNSEDSDNSVSSAPFVKPSTPKSTSKVTTRKSRRQSDKIIDLSIDSSGASTDSSDEEISKRNRKRSNKKIDCANESTSVPSKNTTRDDSDSDLDELPLNKVQKEVNLTCQQCDLTFGDLFDYEKHILEHKKNKSAVVNVKRFSTSELETIADNKDEDSDVEELVNGSQEDVNSDHEKTKEVDEIFVTQDKVLDVNKSNSEVDEIDDLAESKDSETVQNGNGILEKNELNNSSLEVDKENEKDESNLDDEITEKQKKVIQTVETVESQIEANIEDELAEKAVSDKEGKAGQEKSEEIQSNLPKDAENIEQANPERLIEICVEEGEDNKQTEAEQDPLENTSSLYEDAIETPVETAKKTVDDSTTVEKEDSSAVSIVVETDDEETDEIPAKNDNSSIERALHAMDLLSENSDVDKTIEKEVREVSDDSDEELGNKRGRDGDSSDGEDTPRTKRVRFATEKKVLNEDNSICLMDEDERVNLDMAADK